MVTVSRKTGIPIKIGGALPGNWGSKEDGWEDKPKGWDDQSTAKYYKSMSAEEGPTSDCIDKIDGNVDDPGAFCASLRDQVTGTTKWRHGGKK